MDDASAHFRRLATLFEEMADLPAGELAARLSELAGTSPDVAHELGILLAEDARAGADARLAEAIRSEVDAMERPVASGKTVGVWRLVRPIGEGGMGTVYLAERADGAYDAVAAVKLVRGGIPSPSLSERFRSERQILAGLSHPGIARLLDGGSAEDGTPFLVMEFVDGVPIHEWCATRDLGVDQRLRIFLGVCDAVAHAHRELVAHRDLKPSNILVDASGSPKLLDFGIARLVDAVADDERRTTRATPLLTPAYASPEQVLGHRAGVPSDVYSLGVVLYELLTGRLPIDTQGLSAADLVSKLTGEVPPVASAVVESIDTRRRLAGDLDAIVSRMLRKEPEARYPSVESLAEDIRLHLAGFPIRIRRDDRAYRTRKALRRNQGLVSGTALVLLLALSFAGHTILQSRALAAQRDRAEAERATAERVSTFLETLFSEADPNQASAGDLTVREIVDRGAARVLNDLGDEPVARTAFALSLGRVYRALGEYDGAEPLLDTALAVRTRLGSFTVSEVAAARLERGSLAYEQGDYGKSIELLEAALDGYRSEWGDRDDRRLASALGWLSAAMAEAGNLEAAEPLSREALAMYRRIDPSPNEDLASALASRTDLLRTMGRFEEAHGVGLEAVTTARAVYGDDHLALAHALNQHASTLSRWGRADEAVPFVEEGLAIRRSKFEGPHVETAASLGNLANILVGLGRLDEALTHRQASTAMLLDLFPLGHPYTAAGTQSLGALLMDMGRLQEAEPVLVDALAAHRTAYSPNHPNLGHPLTAVGRLYRLTGRLDEALDVLSEAHQIRQDGLPEGHWLTAISALELGHVLDDLGRGRDAQPLFRAAYGVLAETFGEDDARTEDARLAAGAPPGS